MQWTLKALLSGSRATLLALYHGAGASSVGIHDEYQLGCLLRGCSEREEA